MHSFRKITINSLILCAATLSMNSMSFADTYPQPEISTIMFHVDKLPLDKDRMKNIADDLIVLASKHADANQRQLNRKAKFLAIAIRLDSKNKEAMRLNTRLSKGESVVEVSPERYKKASHSIMNLIGMLSKLENDGEVRVFNNYLKDAMKGMVGNDKLLQDHQVSMKRWKNVVPVIANKPAMKPKPLLDAEASIPDENKPEVKPSDMVEVEEKSEIKWHFLTSSIAAPLVMSKKENNQISYYWQMSDIKMTWKPISGELGKIKLLFKPKFDDNRANKIAEQLNSVLSTYWEGFPSAQVTVNLAGNYSERSGKLANLPVAAQLYASLKNVTIPAGARVLGELGNKGEITRGYYFWKQLKELNKREELNKILFCSVNMEKAMSQLIALEKAEFFVRNEVILVNDLEEMTQYFGEITNQNLKIAHEKFVEIQTMIGSRSVGSFSVDKAVRSSLEEIIELNPKHVSAKMILLRGDTKRSSKLDSYFVAEEFKPLIRSMKWIQEGDIVNFKADYMSDKAEIIREHIESVSRYIDSDDAEITRALDEMSDELKTLSKAMTKKNDGDFNERSARATHDRFKQQYNIAEQFITEKQGEK